MTAPLTQRDVSPSDAPAIAALDALCFGVEAWSLGEIQSSLALPTTRGQSVWQGERLVACLLLQCVMDETEILSLCVDPSVRRQNIAFGLVQNVTRSQSAGSTVFLEVAEDNSAARALYECSGFKLLGRRRAYYSRGTQKIDALTYRWRA